MERFSTAQRLLVVKTFYQNGECATQAVRKLRTVLAEMKLPCDSSVRRRFWKDLQWITILRNESFSAMKPIFT